MTSRPLALTRTGETVRIADVNVGRGFQARLRAMGLLPGVVLRVVVNDNCGPFIVALGDTRLALGRGMAHRIMVE